MPLYDYECTKCGEVSEDIYRPLSEFSDEVHGRCKHCSKQAFFRIHLKSTPAAHDWGNCGQGRFYEHASARGEWFRDKKAKREYFKRHGLVEVADYGAGLPDERAG